MKITKEELKILRKAQDILISKLGYHSLTIENILIDYDETNSIDFNKY